MEWMSQEVFHLLNVCRRTKDGTRIFGLNNEVERESSMNRMVCLKLDFATIEDNT